MSEGNTWPEQEALLAWMKKYDVQIIFSKRLELMDAMTEIRIAAVEAERRRPLRDREGLREVIAGHLGVDIDSLDAIMAAVEERLG